MFILYYCYYYFGNYYVISDVHLVILLFDLFFAEWFVIVRLYTNHSYKVPIHLQKRRNKLLILLVFKSGLFTLFVRVTSHSSSLTPPPLLYSPLFPEGYRNDIRQSNTHVRVRRLLVQPLTQSDDEWHNIQPTSDS